MRKILLLSAIIVLTLVSFIFINSIKIPAPIKEKEYDIQITQFT